MKVTLIDYTGVESSDPLYAARLLVYVKNTRLEQSSETRDKIFNILDSKFIHKELNYISKTIRSSWEFVDYTFEIQGVTRAFTHQVVRTRTASYAQQTQRSLDLSDFETMMPQTVYDLGFTSHWNDLMEHIAKTYKAMANAGVPNQDCRGVLPTNVLTNIIAKMNLRTLADLLGKRKNLRAQGEYADVAREMEACVLKIHPWTSDFLDPDRLQTPELDKLLKEQLGSAAPMDKPHISDALKELDALKGTWG